MILTQLHINEDHRKSTIKKMREVYKAPIDPAAEADILGYLMADDVTVR